MSLSAAIALGMAALAFAEPRIEVHSRSTAQGEAVLIAAHGLTRAPSGTLVGHALSFIPGRGGDYIAIAGIDLEAAAGPATLELTIADAQGAPHAWSRELRIEAKKFPTQKLQVDDRFVKLSPADTRRSEKEARRLKQLFALESATLLAKGRFASPIPGAISGRFGERRVFNNVPKNPHTGADLKADLGTPIRVPAAGKVVLAEDLFYSGQSVIIDHGLGLFTFYGHLSRIDVRAGQEVSPGYVLGLVGATGRVTGPHLHWAARLRGARVDPFSLTALPLEDYL